MSYTIRLAQEAKQCIEDQILWYETEIEDGGALLADRWIDLLEKALETLALNPERHGYAIENGKWRTDITIRQLRFKPWKTPSAWRILYTVEETDGQVVILQIRHEKRPLLGEDQP